MKTRTLLGLILGVSLLGAGLAWWWPSQPDTKIPPPAASPPPTEQARVPGVRETPLEAHSLPTPDEAISHRKPASIPEVVLSKAERLDQTRATFSALASGDRKAALAAASQLTDENEREVALMTLVTAWRKGELRTPQQRAAAIASMGLEAGLGMELTQDPELAVLWANQLTEGDQRRQLIREAALQALMTDPALALGLGDQFPAAERRQFMDSIFSAWALKDTDAALNWAQQIADPNERAGALQAIGQMAPVGIGAELRTQDGQLLVNGLLPGTPAALSGQIHAGDRIVAVAQGDNQFIDTGNLPLSNVVQMIRGAPGSLIQLQVMAADAAPDSVPRTVSLIRDQIRHKQ